MTVSCERCGKANRANANFCVGCAAMLPGFVATGPSALQTLKAIRRDDAPSAHAGQPPSDAAKGPAVSPQLLICSGLLMVGAFMAWYLHVARAASKPYASSAVPSASSQVVLTPGFQQRGPFEPDLRGLPGVSDAARAAAARSAQVAPWGDAQAAREPTPPPRRSPLRDPLDTVTRFYRALSAGDGAGAAAFVTASKRTQGPLSGEAMSRFYQSLREPLALRSIRAIDGQVVEVRYTYRATRTACEGRALVTMESADRGAAIRSIAANC